MNGKILAPRRAYAYNLLDNSDFRNPVNQRGQTSYTADGYSVDRWKISPKNSVAEVAIGDGAVSFKGYFYQYLEIDVSKTYTLAACTNDGSVVCVTGVPADIASKTSGNLRVQIGTNSPQTYIRVELSTVDAANAVSVLWAALYEGAYTVDTLPPYRYKGYAAELAECQRYYYVTKSNFYITGYVTLSAKMILSTTMHELTRMRVKPTVSCNGKVVVRTVSGYSTAEGFTTADGGDVSTLSSFNVSDGYGLSLVFVDTVSSVNNSPAALLFKSKVEFFADL